MKYASPPASPTASPSASNKKAHRRPRKRVSALRLSSDTTASLPGYHQFTVQEDVPWDRPPDYPDSTEEADEETEADSEDPYVPNYTPPSRHRHTYSLPPPLTSSPRRIKRFAHQQQEHQEPGPSTHQRRHSSSAVLRSRTGTADVDSYLDSLLERSVHALEISNTLLASSISTQQTMSALFSPDVHSSDADKALEARAIGLSSTLLRNWDAQENWVEQLDKIKQGVDSLFTDTEPTEAGVARNMLSTSPLETLDDQLRQTSSQLRYATQDRTTLVSPAPRALTMYVDASSITTSEDGGQVDGFPDSLLLPSTLGIRKQESSRLRSPGPHATSTASSSTSNLLSSAQALEPQLTQRPLVPSTPAYTMLSNLAARSSATSLNRSTSNLTLAIPVTNNSKSGVVSAPASAPSSLVSSFLSNMTSLTGRSSSLLSHTSPQRLSRSQSSSRPRPSPMTTRRSISADRQSPSSSRSSRSPAPWRHGNESPLVKAVGQMTPPTEGTDEDSSSSSEGVVAKQTISSLRKILDVQPPPSQQQSEAATPSESTTEVTLPPPPSPLSRLRPPTLMARPHTPVPCAGTSTATASISRLFTKGVHTSSTRPRESPLKSVMKKRNGELSGSEPASPSPLVTSLPTSPSGPGPSTPGKHQDQARLQSEAHNPNSTTPSPSPYGITGLGTLVSRALLNKSTSSAPSASNSRSGSRPGSGASTPRRISFAELPESYASTKPEGEAGSVERRKNRSSKRRSRSASGSKIGGDDTAEGAGWWTSWLGGGDVVGGSHGMYGSGLRETERVEDRMTRRLGMSMGMHGGGHLSVLDEWGV